MSVTIMKKCLPLCFLVLLAGCAQTESTESPMPAGKSQVDYDRASYECEREVRMAFPRARGGAATMQSLYVQCMNGRGYAVTVMPWW